MTQQSIKRSVYHGTFVYSKNRTELCIEDGSLGVDKDGKTLAFADMDARDFIDRLGWSAESFYIARETRASIGDGCPNRWPSKSVLSRDIFEEPLRNYYQQVFNLALTILEILSRGLPYGSHIFDEFVSGDQVIASLRLLHYPPQTTTDERQLGVGAHTDFGAITLLLQDENPGLQILDASNEWIPILPNLDAYVVNIGHMLAMWTKGLYKSGVHRVFNRGLKDRYSMPFFFDGALDCPLLPFDGKADGRVLTVKDHLDSRRTSAYGRGVQKQSGQI